MTKKQLNKEIKATRKMVLEIYNLSYEVLNRMSKLDRMLTDKKTRLAKKK